MSTRLRVVLQWPSGAVVYGSRAVKTLVFLTHPFDPGKALPKLGFVPKKEKLIQLGLKLPVGYVLSLIQEPRRTRKSKSLYWKQREGGVL